MSEHAMLSPLAEVPEREKQSLLEAGRIRGRVTVDEACAALRVSSLDGIGVVRVRVWLQEHDIELVTSMPVDEVEDELDQQARERVAEAEAELEAGVVPMAVLSDGDDLVAADGTVEVAVSDDGAIVLPDLAAELPTVPTAAPTPAVAAAP